MSFGEHDNIDGNGNAHLGYVITCHDKNGRVKFLADRTHQKKKWWTDRLSESFGFISKIAAEKQCEKLKFGNPQVTERTDWHKQ